MLSKDQYSTPFKYQARIYLTKTFKTSHESKPNWLFSFFPKKPNLRVLELGCGTGLFWKANASLIPKGWDITLTDYSKGMLEAARHTLSEVEHYFTYQIVDVNEIGYSAEICRQFRSYPATCLLHAGCCTGVYSAGRNGASRRLLSLALDGPH